MFAIHCTEQFHGVGVMNQTFIRTELCNIVSVIDSSSRCDSASFCCCFNYELLSVWYLGVFLSKSVLIFSCIIIVIIAMVLQFFFYLFGAHFKETFSIIVLCLTVLLPSAAGSYL